MSRLGALTLAGHTHGFMQRRGNEGGAGGQLLAGALTAPALAGAKLAHGGGRDA